MDELPIRRAVPVRDNRSAEDITEDDLKLVAEFVSEKKYDSIYVSIFEAVISSLLQILYFTETLSCLTPVCTIKV